MHLQTWSFSPRTVETNSIRKIFAPLPPDSLSCHYQAITVCCLVSCVFSGCFDDDIKSACTEYNTVPRETSWSSCFRLEPGYFSMMVWMAWHVRGEHWMLFFLTLARLLAVPHTILIDKLTRKVNREVDWKLTSETGCDQQYDVWLEATP